eukprot:gb/GFBE01058331.1/.p1 GENE.gb/GFBE01058331.1/~~gb/GFBE01058331.1/.p1  ORF type:complete len:882 (+),score=159.36 gb/GFBE01058331.1/:1-2646(+)
MPPLDYNRPITKHVLNEHWETALKSLIFAATVAACSTAERSGGKAAVDLHDDALIDLVVSQLSAMNFTVERAALAPKLVDIRSFSQLASPACAQKPVAQSETVRFRSDRWRYQKEARQYYDDTVTSFATELLQNSLDAMSKLGKTHQMVVKCHLEDVTCSGHRRVAITFEDNGCGMDRDTIENGLLKVGASASTRADAGRKNTLSDAAGGFGLAKVLLYLCQSGFKIWTKMRDTSEMYVAAEVFREDQELCTVREATANDGCTFGSPVSHGTKAMIFLDPWVMDLGHPGEINEDFYRAYSLVARVAAERYKSQMVTVWQKSNLPIQLSVNGCVVKMNADVGSFQVFIVMPQTGRRFGALYARQVEDSSDRMPPVNIVLQTLSNHARQGRDNKKNPGYFLYLYQDQEVTCQYQSVTLSKKFELTVLLLPRDQHNESFCSGDLLKGTRDGLTDQARKEVSRQVQAYIIDRYAVQPPVAKQTWYTGSKNIPFASWLEGDERDVSQASSPGNRPSRSSDWWLNASRTEADRHFGQRPWSSNMEYNFVIYRDPFIKDANVPAEFRTTRQVKPETLMWMELFGVLVREILDAFSDDVRKSGKSFVFDVGFYVGDHDFVRTIRLDSGRSGFLFNQTYLTSLDCQFGTFSLDAVCSTMACVKNMAIRAVTHDLNPSLKPAAAFELFERNYLKFERSASNSKWSWFKWYKERMEVRYLRELQDGTQAETLKKHIAAMQAPILGDTSFEFLHSERKRLQAEVDEFRADQEALEHEEDPEMPNPLTKMPRMDPQHIRYSQDSCGSRFRCGRSLQQTVADLKSGTISADINIPMIEVFLWTGKTHQWHTTGNRRLKAFKDAGLKAVPVKKIDLRDVWEGRLTTKNGGRSIVIR